MSSIAGFYQCYKQKRAFIHVIESYRKHYPIENLFIINDKGDESLEEIAKQNNANYYYSNENIGHMDWSKIKNKIGNSVIEKALIWLSRIYDATLTFTEDYFILLEDDVWIINKVNTDDLKNDINGGGTGYFGGEIYEYLRKYNTTSDKLYIAGYGGCIFKTLFYRNMLKNKDEIKKHIENFYNLNGTFASDVIISFLTWIYGGTIGQFPGYCQVFDNDYKQRRNENKIEILHQYYEYYDIGLYDNELKYKDDNAIKYKHKYYDSYN